MAAASASRRALQAKVGQAHHTTNRLVRVWGKGDIVLTEVSFDDTANARGPAGVGEPDEGAGLCCPDIREGRTRGVWSLGLCILDMSVRGTT